LSLCEVQCLTRCAPPGVPPGICSLLSLLSVACIPPVEQPPVAPSVLSASPGAVKPDGLVGRIMAMAALPAIVLLGDQPPRSRSSIAAHGAQGLRRQGSVGLTAAALVRHTAAVIWAAAAMQGAAPYMGGGASETLVNGHALDNPLQVARDLVESVCDDVEGGGDGSEPPPGSEPSRPPGTMEHVTLSQAATVMHSVVAWVQPLSAELHALHGAAPSRELSAQEGAAAAPSQRQAVLARASAAAHTLAEHSCLSALSFHQRLGVFLSEAGAPVSCSHFVASTLEAAYGGLPHGLILAGHATQGDLDQEAADLQQLFAELDTDGDGYLSPGEGLTAVLQVGVDGSCAADEAAACQAMGHALLLMDQHDKGVVDRYDVMLFVHAVLAATSGVHTSTGMGHLVDTHTLPPPELSNEESRRPSLCSVASEASSALSWAISDSETDGGWELGRLPSPRRGGTASSTSGRSGVPPRQASHTAEHVGHGEDAGNRALFTKAGAIADLVLAAVGAQREGPQAYTPLGPGMASYSSLLHWYMSDTDGALQDIVRCAVHTMPAVVFRERALDACLIRGASAQDATAVVSAAVRRQSDHLLQAFENAVEEHCSQVMLPAPSGLLSYDVFVDTVFRLSVLSNCDDVLGGFAEVQAWQEASPVRTAMLQCMFSSLPLQQAPGASSWAAPPQDVLELLWELLQCGAVHSCGDSRTQAATLFHTLSADGWRLQLHELAGYLQREMRDVGGATKLARDAFAHTGAAGDSCMGLNAFQLWCDAMKHRAAAATAQ